jgi:hypothetical protein
VKSAKGKKTAAEQSAEPEESRDVAAQQRKAELKDACATVERKLIPAGSTLEREMAEHLEQWNRTLNPDAKQNLTEDVNSLVRDYIRKISRTLKASNLDEARIENLATALVDTPGLMKIKYRDALLAYIRLYIIKILKNSK